MKTVLVATDLSGRSDIAVARAVQIARQQGATLHVLHVVDCELPLMLAEAQREAAETILQAKVASLEKDGSIRTRISAILGDPCEEISFKAEEIEAELVVMGRHRHRRLAEFFTGTTIERIARMATLPLLVATRPADRPYSAAVVGVDFSKSATRAVSIAASLVGTAGLSLVHSYHVPFKGLTMRTDRHGALSAADRELIEAGIKGDVETWVAACGINEKELAVLLREGEAVNILSQIATETGSDLICLGAHSRSWLPSAILGSTAGELLSHSDFDILVAPL